MAQMLETQRKYDDLLERYTEAEQAKTIAKSLVAIAEMAKLKAEHNLKRAKHHAEESIRANYGTGKKPAESQIKTETEMHPVVYAAEDAVLDAEQGIRDAKMEYAVAVAALNVLGLEREALQMVTAVMRDEMNEAGR